MNRAPPQPGARNLSRQTPRSKDEAAWGYRWNINNDEIEARRYREEVPPRWRIFYAAVVWIAVIGVIATGASLGLWLRSSYEYAW